MEEKRSGSWWKWWGIGRPDFPVFIGLMTWVLVLGTALINSTTYPKVMKPTPLEEVEVSNPEVLGRWYGGEPQIMVAGPQGYSNGGVVSMASTDEPAVILRGSQISGMVQVKLYRATEASLFAYLTYNDEGQQISPTIDTEGLNLITETEHALSTDGSMLNLPLESSGIYLVKISGNDVNTDAFIIRSHFGVLAKEGDNQLVFWGQKFEDKRSITEGSLRLISFKNKVSETASASFNPQGIATAPISESADVAWIRNGEDYALVPLNLHYLNNDWSYVSYVPKTRQVKHFVYTDRPLYRPGDTLYFKTILRDDDDARYSIPRQPIKVRLSDGYGEGAEVIYERELSLNEFGSVAGEVSIPEDVPVGGYIVSVDAGLDSEGTQDWGYGYSYSSVYVEIQHFRKPEYFLEVDTDRFEYVAGDEIVYTIEGQYFSGQALANQQVRYVINSGTYYDYANSQEAKARIKDDYVYGSWYGTRQGEGTVKLDDHGRAEVRIEAEAVGNKSQIYNILVRAEGVTGTADEAVVNALVHSGEYGIYRSDQNYSYVKNQPVEMKYELISRVGKSVANIPLSAKIERTWWVREPLQPGQKYANYSKMTEQLPEVKATSNSEGEIGITFQPTAGGSYKLYIQGEDERGNKIEKEDYVWVRDEDPYIRYMDNAEGDLQITVDKLEAEPDGEVTATLTSVIPNRDVFLGIERGRLSRYQIVPMQGTTTQITLPMQASDMPNVYLKAQSFSDTWLDSAQVNVPVSTKAKQLSVRLTPDAETYGPGETVTLNVATEDGEGTPVAAEVGVWAVDKAIFELTSDNTQDIFKAFWQERVNSTLMDHSLEGITALMAEGGGGCFLSETPVMMADGTMKSINQIKAGEWVLTRAGETNSELVAAKVKSVHVDEAQGYLTINGSIKVTPNHRMWVNEDWKEAGSIQIGDLLVDETNTPVVVETIFWTRGGETVYNLEIEKYQTYFAGGVWVHNQKGAVRDTFSDTAYWNPRVITDSSGRAQVQFELPDNLTTWTIAAVGTTIDTTVGQAKQDIVVSKEVVVRPILPNILRVGDEAVLSAQVQNFTDHDYTFKVEAQFEAGEILGNSEEQVKLAAGEGMTVGFRYKPRVVNEEAKFDFTATAQEDEAVGDRVIVTLPIQPDGYFDRLGGASALGSHTYEIEVPSDYDAEKSSLSLGLASSLVRSLPEVMKFLISYPYGCVEQTISRLVPAVIVAEKPGLFESLHEEHDMEEIVERGINRLSSLQNGDGGWGWWNESVSQPFVTAYVAEYLVRAREAGYDVPNSLINKATRYFEDLEVRSDSKDGLAEAEKRVIKEYALASLNPNRANGGRELLDDLGVGVDLLPWLVMANLANGYTDNERNGVNYLASLAKSQGEASYWEAGEQTRFGSKDTTTAMAVKALLKAGNKEDAYRGILYLNRGRQTPYWSHTFATGQVVDALVTYGTLDDEASPNFSYEIKAGETVLASGRVTNANEEIGMIEIPLDLIKANNVITVTQNGTGSLYSTLASEWFITGQQAELSHGLAVKREYFNEKGPEYTPGVGDTVEIELEIENQTGSGANYVVIEDHLPAGMIPINPGFKNEQGNKNYFWNQSQVVGMDVGLAGVVISLRRLPEGTSTYRYKARVVNEGAYQTPPAIAMLMYAPEVYGRSATEIVNIDAEARYDATLAARRMRRKKSDTVADAVKDRWVWLVVLSGAVVGVVGILSYWGWGRYKARKILKGQVDESGKQMGVGDEMKEELDDAQTNDPLDTNNP